ncbi:hypothetical protein [Bifidobacterium mongoliense]
MAQVAIMTNNNVSLIFTGHGLARFTGYSCLAFAIAAAAGSWIC